MICYHSLFAGSSVKHARRCFKAKSLIRLIHRIVCNDGHPITSLELQSDIASRTVVGRLGRPISPHLDAVWWLWLDGRGAASVAVVADQSTVRTTATPALTDQQSQSKSRVGRGGESAHRPTEQRQQSDASSRAGLAASERECIPDVARCGSTARARHSQRTYQWKWRARKYDFIRTTTADAAVDDIVHQHDDNLVGPTGGRPDRPTHQHQRTARVAECEQRGADERTAVGLPRPRSWPESECVEADERAAVGLPRSRAGRTTVEQVRSRPKQPGAVVAAA